MRRTLHGLLGFLVVLGLFVAQSAPAYAQVYTFTKVADSAEDGFSPFSFECSAINNRGDIAFRTARVPRRGSQLIQGIYRANAGGKTKLTTIAEFGDGFDFLGQIPSINDLGHVAFAVRDFNNRDFTETVSIMRGDGKKPVTIASGADGFNTFGFEPTVNNSSVVAFKGQLTNFDQGLFSGQGGKGSSITTHYLASTSQFSEFGTLSRPSISDVGPIGFEEQVDNVGAAGVFVTEGEGFRTIAAPDPNVNVGRPNLNNGGTAAFHRFFNDRAGEELVMGDGGPLTTIADTNGPFQSFGFFLSFVPPALNDNGDVAFLADLDEGGSGIFTGPDPVADKIIQTGDTLDGAVIKSLRFCDDGLNDSGQLAFQATFDDPSVPDGIRVAIYRATLAG
jgi:hypothetical protein